MEVSALKYSGGIGLHGRSPLLRLQSDERLIAFLRRGNMTAFEVLVSRYETRLMAFCRHLLGSREDAEDVLQEVLTAAFNAILADERPINVRPWLYRIARNRSLNHLRRISAIGVDSMDHHLSEHGATTADKVHEREEFRMLVGDIHELPETQKTALVLREMDALSYEQIAEAMETTVPSVKSLLVRARVSLAEAAEARLLSCDEVRIELAEVAEGLQRRPGPLVRRHLRSCKRCAEFRTQLKATNKALAALLPVGPLAMLHKLLFLHLGHSAGAGSGAAGAGSSAGAAGAGAVGSGAAGAGALGAGTTVAAGSGAVAGSSGLVSAGIGALAGKAAAGLAAAALVTAGAVEADHTVHHRRATGTPVPQASAAVFEGRPDAPEASVTPAASPYAEPTSSVRARAASRHTAPAKPGAATKTSAAAGAAVKAASTRPALSPPVKAPGTTTSTAATPKDRPATPAGRTQTQSDPTVLPSPSASGTFTSGSPSGTSESSTGGASLDPYPAQTAQASPTSTSSSSPPASSSSSSASSSDSGSSTSTSTPASTTTSSGGSDGSTGATSDSSSAGTSPSSGSASGSGSEGGGDGAGGGQGTGDPGQTTPSSPLPGAPAVPSTPGGGDAGLVSAGG